MISIWARALLTSFVGGIGGLICGLPASLLLLLLPIQSLVLLRDLVALFWLSGWLADSVMGAVLGAQRAYRDSCR
jgi:hypothetical protein